jgi:hypothetical protein
MRAKPRTIALAIAGSSLTGCAGLEWSAQNEGDGARPDAGSSTGAAPADGDVADDGDGRTTLPGWTASVSVGSSESEDSAGDGLGFIMDPDGGGPAFECDVWAQNCPAGEKCNIWANDGGSAWNATKCVPVMPNADAESEPCTTIGDALSGLDSCELGSFCWDMDPETGLGLCVAFCIGSEANPTCADPEKRCTGKDFNICLPVCSPIEQDCPVGCACYPSSDEFQCFPVAAEEDMGHYGDDCEFINVCQPGLFCSNPESVPSCIGGIGCCSSYCDLSAPDCPGMEDGVECIPWYEEGQAPPNFASVGACAIPG